MFDFLDGAIDAVSSAVSSAVAEVMPGSQPAARNPAPDRPATAAAPPKPAATDEHHDWVTGVFGVDPRNFVAGLFSSDGAPSGGAGQPSAAKPADDGLGDDFLHFFHLGKRFEREERVQGAVDRLNAMKERDIAALSTDERVKLLEDLRANGPPGVAAKGVQKRLYDNTPIDPAQEAIDDARREAIAKELAGDKELQKAQANWGTLSDEQKAAALRKVIAAQSKAMGVAPPEIVIEHGMQTGGTTVDGLFEQDGKLHINMDRDSMTNNFPQAVSIATHENTHHYQAEQVKRLQAGTLQPGDPEYDQTRLFAANNEEGSYVEPFDGARTPEERQSALETHKNQPVERHAWNNGSQTAKKIDGALKTARGL